MLDRLESSNRFAHRVGICAACQSRRKRREHILHVVHAFQVHFVFRRQHSLAVRSSRNKLIPALKKESLFEFCANAEHNHVRPKPLRPSSHRRIIGIQYCNVTGRLVHEYSVFRRGIIRKVFVSIHMIRSEI